MPFRTIDEFLKYAKRNNIKIYNYKVYDRFTKDYGDTGTVITVVFDLYEDNFKASILAKGFDKLDNIHIGGWSEVTHGYVCFSEIDYSPYLLETKAVNNIPEHIELKEIYRKEIDNNLYILP
jgi:hypothetical protein